MRVTTGLARGRRLITLKNEDVRPTADKVKQALFNAIQFDLEGRNVLDLFAGSGQLGIEALSRGAKFAVFTDINKSAADAVKKNIATCGFEDRTRVINADAFSFLKTTDMKFGIVFMDPPYSKGLTLKALENIGGVLSKDAFVICETADDENLPSCIGHLTLVKNAKYSKTRLYIYRDADY